MKTFSKIILFLLGLAFIFYLSLPSPTFPEPPPDALQSNEPGDTETPLRRAYFTNYSREEVLAYYQNQLRRSKFLNIPMPTYRLNYPPEEAQTLIRDQTRSTFLEEIVHPFRESVFVNGFEPKDPKDKIVIAGKQWRQKITVRLVPSHALSRLIVFGLTIGLLVIIIREWASALKDLFNRTK